MTDTQKLLAEYAQTGSEPAFRELVTRYLNLVYSTAHRLVNGDTQLAEDITQTVFINLAKKGRTLSPEVMLGGWLHQHTFNVATTALRGERRRQSRERAALEMNTLHHDPDTALKQVAPILDEAITQLGHDDRTAILLRFFEQRDFHAVGEALGSTEDAARMRVNRALEKLHTLLKHRGVTLSLVGLGTMLAAEAVTAAPAGLAVSIPAAALASAATGTGTTLTLLKLMASTKLKLSLAALAVLGTATTLVVQHQSQTELRSENDSFRRQIAQLKTENESFSNLVASVRQSAPPDDHSAELLRLRGEVSLLRQQTNDLARLSRKNEEPLSQATSQPESTNQISMEDQVILRQTHAVDAMSLLLTAFKNYTTNHTGQYPENFDQLIASGDLKQSNFNGNLGLQDFEIAKDGWLDFQTNKIILTLRVPIPRPGQQSVGIRGSISPQGLLHTEIIGVAPDQDR